MSPESLLAEKVASYRSTFDKACRGFFSGSEGVTLEYEHDDADEAAEVASERPSENSNAGSKFAQEIRAAVRFIADDFAHEFNAKLAAAARNDPSVELIADNYEMGEDHVRELETLLTATVAPLLAKLDAGDLDGARRATLDAWPALERRIRSKWQAYFVLTFQDVSVERKAARDRKKLQSRFDPSMMETMSNAESARNALTDFAAPVDERRGLSPWFTVMALLLLAAAGGWLLMRGHAHRAAAAISAPAP